MSKPGSNIDYLVHYFGIPRYQWIFVLSIGIFMVLFLLAFQPFGVNNFDPKFHISLKFLISILAFGTVVVLSLAVNEFLLRPLLIKQLDRRKLIAWLVWTYLLTATVIFYFYNYLGNWHDFRLASYFGFIRDIGMLISLPVAGFIFYVRHESLKSEYVQLKSIHMQAPASKLLHFSSDNNKDQISVALEDLLFLESQDNYVAVVFLDQGARRGTLIRSSLKRLEDANDEPMLLRCHRSFMVNLLRVRTCHGNQHGLKLGVDGADRSVPVSRTYTEEVLQRLGR